MHVGALTVFEGESFFTPEGRFRIGAIRDLVESRLPRIPRFRKRVQTVALGAGQPIWVDDDRFDITHHVRLTALPAPGDRPPLLAPFQPIPAQAPDRTR